MVAPLSFTSQYGYYGLRVNPSFDQVVGTIRKPLRIPVPDRAAKWYALSAYRSFILDAEQKYNSVESAKIDYRQSGAELPESAAQVRPSEAGDDPAFARIHADGQRMEQKDAYDLADSAMKEDHRQMTELTRNEQLRRSHGPNRMNPVVEASHEQLVEAGVPHEMPAPRMPPLIRSWPAPPPQWSCAGQLQAPEFPTFESLNMGQPQDLRKATLTPSQNLTYEQARRLVAEPTGYN